MSQDQWLRFLSGMGMGFTFIDIQATEHLVPLGSLGQHTFDGVFQNSFGFGVAEVLIHDSGQSSGAPGSTVMGFGIPFFARQNDLLGIDDDHMVPVFNVRGKEALVFAPQNSGHLGCQASKHLVRGVDNPPFTVDVFLRC